MLVKTVFILRQDPALLHALFIFEVEYHTSEYVCESTRNTYHDIIGLESLPTTKCMWQIGHVWFYFNYFKRAPFRLTKYRNSNSVSLRYQQNCDIFMWSSVAPFSKMDKIPAWISNYIHYKLWMKLLIHSKTSTVLGMLLLIHAGI